MKQLNGSGFQSWMPHHRGIGRCLIRKHVQKLGVIRVCPKRLFLVPQIQWFIIMVPMKKLSFGGTVYFISGLTHIHRSIRYYFQLPCKDCGPWGPSFQTQVIETSKRMDHLGCIYFKQENGCP